MLFYLSKKTRPDIQVAVSFLSTRIKSPTCDDWKKLGRCVRYLAVTKELPLTLEASVNGTIRWWVGAYNGVHPNMRSHTGATMTLGKGSPYSLSLKQKINTVSSTEAELVGISDAVKLVIWRRLFIESQGYSVTDNVLYQSNQSTILLANNGKRSSTRNTYHINIRFLSQIMPTKRTSELSTVYLRTCALIHLQTYKASTRICVFEVQKGIVKLAKLANKKRQECADV